MSEADLGIFVSIFVAVGAALLVLWMFPPVRRREKMKTFLVYDFSFGGCRLIGGVQATSIRDVAERYDFDFCDEDTLHRKGSPRVFFIEELRKPPAEFFTDSQDR